ncbi:MAG: iron dicitrate transport regulator FecR, partial [Actinomycetota bacterium]|nr:iron dicitrate transport regulator FecR [Actinomycetota bacterium]
MGVRAREGTDLAALAGLVRGAGSVVALTGAGISVPSGIPDFRSPGTGLWETVDPMKVAHIDAFRSDPVGFWRFYGERFATLGAKRPNAAHRALVAIERAGMLDGVITQNIDMLHRKAGTRELVEVHGSIARCSCPGCGESLAAEQVRPRLLADPAGVPRCER